MYIDPASGSLVLQIVIAGAVSAFAFLGRFRRVTKAFLTSLFTKHPR